MKQKNSSLSLLAIVVALGSFDAQARRSKRARVEKEPVVEEIIKEILPRKRPEIEGHMVRPVKSVEEFENLKKETPLLFVDFWSRACGICQLMKPDVQELSLEYKDKVTFVSVNVGLKDLVSLGQKYAPSGLPTYLLLLNGEKFEVLTGSQAKEGLAIYINKMIRKAEKDGITPQPATAPSVEVAPVKPEKPVEKAKQPITITIETTTPMSAQVVKTGK